MRASAIPATPNILAELAGGVDVAMMLACPELRVVPVTIHLSLAEAVRVLDTDKIVRAGRLAATGLKALFGIERPRLAVAALNPHAGEQGSMGDEEGRVIAPAIEALQARGHRCARARARRHAVPCRGARQPTTRCSACITTRR